MEINIPEKLIKPYTVEGIENGEDQAESQPGGNTGKVEELIEFCQWVSKTADDYAKENGYPGTGHVPPDKLGELFGRMADKHLPEWLKAMTQEATGGGLLGLIFFDNYMHYRKKQLGKIQEKGNNNGE